MPADFTERQPLRRQSSKISAPARKPRLPPFFPATTRLFERLAVVVPTTRAEITQAVPGAARYVFVGSAGLIATSITIL
jgi:hypothetical protein